MITSTTRTKSTAVSKSTALRPELNYSLSWITGTKGPQTPNRMREREREREDKVWKSVCQPILSDSHFSVDPGGLFFSPFLDTGVAALRQWLKDALPAPGQSTNRWAHELAQVTRETRGNCRTDPPCLQIVPFCKKYPHTGSFSTLWHTLLKQKKH